ncbi:MAG: type II secretion system protein [Dehalococcoidia bacterium]|nr:MAG: type II secretion system protein [Dehalococcoidia bacterium]
MYYVIKKHEKGISLIETVVGLAIISIISVAFLSSLTTSFMGAAVQGKAAVGEAIATSQMEYIKTQPFSNNEWSYTVSTSSRSYTQQPSWWDERDPPLLDSDYTGYYALVTADDFDADGDGTIEVPGDDDSVREITVNVYNAQNDLSFALTTYKANR